MRSRKDDILTKEEVYEQAEVWLSMALRLDYGGAILFFPAAFCDQHAKPV